MSGRGCMRKEQECSLSRDCFLCKLRQMQTPRVTGVKKISASLMRAVRAKDPPALATVDVPAPWPRPDPPLL